MRSTVLYVVALLVIIFHNSCNKNNENNTEVIERHANGTIKKEVVWEDRMDSVYVERSYYDNGQLKFYTTYSKGIRNGFGAFFWETGEARGLLVYKNGKMTTTGPGEFYKNGQPMMIFHFDENETGYKIKYYENGNKDYEEHLDHGKPVLRKQYKEDGSLLKVDTLSVIE